MCRIIVLLFEVISLLTLQIWDLSLCSQVKRRPIQCHQAVFLRVEHLNGLVSPGLQTVHWWLLLQFPEFPPDCAGIE